MNETVPVLTDKEVDPANPETGESRSSVYRLLSAFFMKEADSGLLSALQDADVAGALGELDPDIRRLLFDPEPKKLLDELADEFAALFLVPGGIPPYESVRIHGMLNQKPSWEVEEFYRCCGLAVREESRMLPDHLGMELDFLGRLAAREAEARRQGDDALAAKWACLQAEFFQNHIAAWAFVFLRDLERLAYHPFYKTAGSLTRRFLETEKEYLGIPGGGEENRFPQI